MMRPLLLLLQETLTMKRACRWWVPVGGGTRADGGRLRHGRGNGDTAAGETGGKRRGLWASAYTLQVLPGDPLYPVNSSEVLVRTACRRNVDGDGLMGTAATASTNVHLIPQNHMCLSTHCTTSSHLFRKHKTTAGTPTTGFTTHALLHHSSSNNNNSSLSIHSLLHHSTTTTGFTTRNLLHHSSTTSSSNNNNNSLSTHNFLHHYSTSTNNNNSLSTHTNLHHSTARFHDKAATTTTTSATTTSSNSSGSGEGLPDGGVLPYSAIPGPKPLPLVGNKLLFTTLGGYPLERFWESAWKLYRDYGPVVRVARFSGKLDMVVVFEPEDTRRIFQAEGKYPTRPGLDILIHYRASRPQWFSSPGLVPGNGPEWRRLRSAIHPLLRRQVVSAYRPAQAQVAKDLVSAIPAYSERRRLLQGFHENEDEGGEGYEEEGRQRNGDEGNTMNGGGRRDEERGRRKGREMELRRGGGGGGRGGGHGGKESYLVSDLLPLLFHYTLEAVGVVSVGTRLGCLDHAHEHTHDQSGSSHTHDQPGSSHTHNHTYKQESPPKDTHEVHSPHDSAHTQHTHAHDHVPPSTHAYNANTNYASSSSFSPTLTTHAHTHGQSPSTCPYAAHADSSSTHIPTSTPTHTSSPTSATHIPTSTPTHTSSPTSTTHNSSPSCPTRPSTHHAHAHARARSIISANEDVLGVLGEAIFSPPFYKLFPTSNYRRLARAQDTITRVVEEEVERRREERAAQPSHFAEAHPFLESLFSNPDLASPKDILLLLVEIFQGGIDATATTLGFCLHYLALNPDTQDVLYQELRDVDPSTHSLQGLSYLRAVVQETLRLRPSASARSRFIQEDMIFSGYLVPAGTFVLSPPVVACHDPNTFPDPHAFRPERWLTRARSVRPPPAPSPRDTPTPAFPDSDPSPPTGDTSTNPQTNLNTRNLSTANPSSDGQGGDGGRVHPYTIIAFGHGARMCPGRRLAEQEIYLAIIQVVKTFKMEVSGEKKAVEQVIRLNMMPDAAFSIIFTPRN